MKTLTELFKSVEGEAGGNEVDLMKKFGDLHHSVKSEYSALYKKMSNQGMDKLPPEHQAKIKKVNEYLQGKADLESVHDHYGVKQEPDVAHIKTGTYGKNYVFTPQVEKGKVSLIGTKKNDKEGIASKRGMDSLFGDIGSSVEHEPKEKRLGKDFDAVKKYLTNNPDVQNNLTSSRTGKANLKKVYGEEGLNALIPPEEVKKKQGLPPSRIDEAQKKIDQMNKFSNIQMVDPKINPPAGIKPKITIEQLKGDKPEDRLSMKRWSKIKDSTKEVRDHYSHLTNLARDGTLREEHKETLGKYHDYADGKISSEDLRNHLNIKTVSNKEEEQAKLDKQYKMQNLTKPAKELHQRLIGLEKYGIAGEGNRNTLAKFDDYADGKIGHDELKQHLNETHFKDNPLNAIHESEIKKSFFSLSPLSKSVDSGGSQLSIFEQPKKAAKLISNKTPSIDTGSKPKQMTIMDMPGMKRAENMAILHPDIKSRHKALTSKVKSGEPLEKHEQESLDNINGYLDGNGKITKHSDLKKHFGIQDSAADSNKLAAEIKDGKYHYKGGSTDLFGQEHMGKMLAPYVTHREFLDNPKPEHKELADQIKEMHNGDETAIREHFNNTIGRYKHHTEKPNGLPDERHTLMNHEKFKDSPEHGLVDGLEEKHRREMDELGTGDKFADAVINSDSTYLKPGEHDPGKPTVSNGLLSYLRKYKADHMNPEEKANRQKRTWSMFKDNSWDKDNLKRFYEFPTTSNRQEASTEVSDNEKTYSSKAQKQLFDNRKKYIDNKISRPLYESKRDYIKTKASGEATEEQEQLKHRKDPIKHRDYDTEVKGNYKQGDTINYAGQNHQIDNVTGNIAFATGDDSRQRRIKLADIENLKHEDYTPDIHSTAFKKLLHGGTEEKDLDKYLTEPKASLVKHLESLGFNEEERQKIHNYLNGTKPNEFRHEKGQKAKKRLTAKDEADTSEAKNQAIKDSLRVDEGTLGSGNTNDDDEERNTLSLDELDAINNSDDPNILKEKDILDMLGKHDTDRSKEVHANAVNEHNKNRKEYEEVIQNHADHLNKVFHPHANKDYKNQMEEATNKLNSLPEHLRNKFQHIYDDIHPMKTISEKTVLDHLDQGDTNALTPEHIAKRIGIKLDPPEKKKGKETLNAHAEKEIMNHLMSLYGKGIAVLGRDKTGKARASLSSNVLREALKKSFGVLTQTGDYIKGKLKNIMSLKLIKAQEMTFQKEIEMLVKSFGPRDLWDEVDSTRARARRELNQILELSEEKVEDSAYTKIIKSFEVDTYIFGELLLQKDRIMKSAEFAEYEKILPEPALSFDDDGKPMLVYIDPLET